MPYMGGAPMAIGGGIPYIDGTMPGGGSPYMGGMPNPGGGKPYMDGSCILGGWLLLSSVAIDINLADLFLCLERSQRIAVAWW